MTIRTKLITVTISALVLLGVITMFIVNSKSQNALSEAEFEKLTAVRTDIQTIDFS